MNDRPQIANTHHPLAAGGGLMGRMVQAWADWDCHAAKTAGLAKGYRAGFVAGVEIGGAGVLLAIQHALPDRVLLDLLPKLPYTGEYQRLQRVRQPDNRPCGRGCGACSKCIRSSAAQRNLACYGSLDYPGGRMPWLTLTQPSTGESSPQVGPA